MRIENNGGWRDRVSIRDLAIFAGLSERTVRDHLEGDVQMPGPTAARLRAAFLDLGIDTDPWGAFRVRTIGLIIPDISTAFFSALADSMCKEAGDQGCDLVVLPSDGDLRVELRHLSRLEQLQVNGIVISTNNGADDRLAARCRRMTNLVAVNEEIVESAIPLVSGDNLQGGAALAQHFLDHGHTEFSYIGGPAEVRSTVERGSGFKARLRAQLGRDLAFRQHLGAHSFEHGYSTVMRMHRTGRLPRAIFAGSDVIALGVLAAIGELSLAVPEDVSVAAIDGTGALSLAVPAITVARVPTQDIAQRAVDLSLRPRRREARQVRLRLPMDLVEGGSVTDRRCRDFSNASRICLDDPHKQAPRDVETKEP